ncbi:MAG: DUF3726 domain-containing protein [Paracoccaceae bacterium]
MMTIETAGPALSFSEIEALATKSARGAGFCWGMAEETAFATAWLERFGLRGLDLLLARLSGQDQNATPAIAEICPLMLGTELADFARLPGGLLDVGKAELVVACPAMILPFLCAIAKRDDCAFAVSWRGARLTVTNTGPVAIEEEAGIATPYAEKITIVQLAPAAAPIPDDRLGPLPRPRALPPSLLKALDRFAQRTYVPASEQSRAGAGGSGSDNQ